MSAVRQHAPSHQEKRESSAGRPLQGLGHRSRVWILFLLAKAFTPVFAPCWTFSPTPWKTVILSRAKWNAGVFPETPVDGRCVAA